MSDNKQGVAALMETTKENVIAAAVRTNDKNNNNVKSEKQASPAPVSVPPSKDAKYIISPETKPARSNDLDETVDVAKENGNFNDGTGPTIVVSTAVATVPLPAEMGQDFDPYGESLITY